MFKTKRPLHRRSPACWAGERLSCAALPIDRGQTWPKRASFRTELWLCSDQTRRLGGANCGTDRLRASPGWSEL